MIDELPDMSRVRDMYLKMMISTEEATIAFQYAAETMRLAGPGWHPTQRFDVLTVGGLVMPGAWQVRAVVAPNVGYVLHKASRTRPTRFMTSGQSVGLKLGDYADLYHFSTGESLGAYRVVGIVRQDNDQAIGEVPTRLISHCVVQ